MIKYTLQAKNGDSVTSCLILARDNFCAKVMAAQKIYSNHVADKRYAKGEITLKIEGGGIIYRIKAE